MRVRKISNAGRVYLVLTVMFAGLAASEYIEKTAPSGRWGWLQAFAESNFGPYGYAKLLLACAILWGVVFLISWIKKSDLNEEKK